MSSPTTTPTAEDALGLYHALSPEEKRRFAEGLRANDGADVIIRAVWYPLDVIAGILGKSKSQVSRYARDGKLISNGMWGSLQLKVRLDSVALFLVRQHLKYIFKQLRELNHELLRKRPNLRKPYRAACDGYANCLQNREKQNLLESAAYAKERP